MSRLSLNHCLILIYLPASLSAGNLATHEPRLNEGLDWGPGCHTAAHSQHRHHPTIPAGRLDFIYLESDALEIDQMQDRMDLRGKGMLRKNDTYLEADEIIYHRQPGNVWLNGAIYLEQPGIRLTADEGFLKPTNDQGWLSNVEFRLPEHLARGHAERVDMLSQARSRFADARFTTCPPGNHDWSIGASEMEIDRESGWGNAYHAVLRFGDLPVLYTPYISFPVDDRRKSGLLLPSWGNSNDLGAEFTLPYYLNLAPNYDATLTPRWMSRRGLMLGGEFRFMTAHQRATLSGETLDDKVTSDEHDSRRSAFRIRHTSQPFMGLNTRIDYKEVSDRDYLDDFSSGLEFSSTRHLERIAEANYVSGNWRLNGRLQDFQTVDKSIAPNSYPYSLLPRLTLNYQKLLDRLNTDLRLDSEYTRFDHDTELTGQRLRLVPSAGLKWSRPWGHLTPRLSLQHVAYRLSEAADTETESSPSFTVPTFSLDSGLVFERDSRWFGEAATQTLEPRLFYLYVPFQEQADAPDFDTADLELSFANLFKENRFTGGDRVGDANQLALGITSRWLENDSGLERLRASIGQIFYLRDREVQLTGGTEEQSESAVVAELSTRLGSHWRTSLNLRWDPHKAER
ncbi:MAG: LPS-assembly protein LptD, partial [Gammaproteobacteria bacterium]|nr:LPS-assembly protein LptD [Gammaproteobacteria bacterium]